MSSGKKQAPLQIKFDTSTNAFVAGSTIRGRIVLQHASVAHRDSSVTVTLIGDASTEVWTDPNDDKSVHGDYAPLLDIRQDLTRGMPLANEDIEWPFSVTLPLEPQPINDIAKKERSVARWASDFAENPKFQASSQHTLPPSFKHGYAGFQRRYESSVQYKIKAKLNSGPGDISCSRAIAIAPPHSSSEAQQPKELDTQFVAKSDHMLPKDHTRALSNMFRHRPHFTFTLSIYTPQEATLGEQLGFFIRVKPDLSQSTVPSVPTTKLDSFSFEIRASTNVRTSGGFASDVGTDSDTIAFQCFRHPGTAFTEAQGYAQRIDSQPLKGASLVPSFKTYNVSRIFEAHVKWSVSCAEEHFKVNDSVHINILSGTSTKSLKARELSDGHLMPEFDHPGDLHKA